MTAPSLPSETKRLYTRALPSGGYVAIEAQRIRTLFGPEKLRGHLIVERRPESRREGHRPPIAACTEQTRLRDVIDALYPIAHSDHGIAEVLARKVMVSAVPRPRR